MGAGALYRTKNKNELVVIIMGNAHQYMEDIEKMMTIKEFLEKLRSLIEKYYPHLRHNLRDLILIDDFLQEKIIAILEVKK